MLSSCTPPQPILSPCLFDYTPTGAPVKSIKGFDTRVGRAGAIGAALAAADKTPVVFDGFSAVLLVQLKVNVAVRDLRGAKAG